MVQNMKSFYILKLRVKNATVSNANHGNKTVQINPVGESTASLKYTSSQPKKVRSADLCSGHFSRKRLPNLHGDDDLVVATTNKITEILFAEYWGKKKEKNCVKKQQFEKSIDCKSCE